MSSAIAENLAYRWFCFLTIDDPVFDHSTVSYFIERIGREGFSAFFQGMNEELLRPGLLSPEVYADSSLVKANVNSRQLSRSGLTVAEFRERAIEENGLFVLNDSGADENGMGGNEILPGFQGSSAVKPSGHRCPLAHQQAQQAAGTELPGQRHNAIVDRGGFILSRGVTHASEREWKALPQLLEHLPLPPVSLAADTALGGTGHHGLYPHPSQTGIEHGGQRRL